MLSTCSAQCLEYVIEDKQGRVLFATCDVGSGYDSSSVTLQINSKDYANTDST